MVLRRISDLISRFLQALSEQTHKIMHNLLTCIAFYGIGNMSITSAPFRTRKNKSGADRYVDGQTSVLPRDLKRCAEQSGCAILAVQDLTPRNVRKATNVPLLGARDRYVGAKGNRAWRCSFNGHIVPIKGPEYWLDTTETVEALRKYVRLHDQRLESLLNQFESNSKANIRCKKANKGGG